MTRPNAAQRQAELLDKLVFLCTSGECESFTELMRETAAAGVPAAGFSKCSRSECCARLLERLYSLLGVLDSKANGLLQVNSMFIALISLLGVLGTTGQGATAPTPLHTTVAEAIAAVTLLLFLVSSVLCMLIVRVNWGFYHHVGKLVGANAHQAFKAEILKLAQVADSRTIAYIRAWRSALLCFPLMALAAIIAR